MTLEKHAPPQLISDPTSIWALVDDMAGNRSQVVGVAEALGRPYEVKELAYGRLGSLPNVLLGPTFRGLTGASRKKLAPPWPRLIIAAGRRTAPVARFIKKASGGQSRLVQIMWPGWAGAREFDLIAVPDHDPPRRSNNVVSITGSPHRFTEDSLGLLRQTWEGRFTDLPRPWIAVLVGGTTKNRTFTETMARDLARLSRQAARGAGGSLLVTTSRRTGMSMAGMFGDDAVESRAFDWSTRGENPYAGFLACADYIVVTGDSMSMCTEACATRAPVYIFAPPELISGKHERFHDRLYSQGYAKPFAGRLETWTHPLLNPAILLAERAGRLLEP